MARRRRRVRRVTRSFPRRARKAASSNNVLIGLGLTSTIEPMVDNLTSGIGLGIPDDLLKLGLGWYLAKRKGYIRGIGYGLFARGAGNLVGNLLSGVNLGGILGGNKTTTATVTQDPMMVG